jgi:hypothetical protein
VRKAELKVGEEYAAGSSARYDRWKMTRIRIVELDGERKRSNGTVAKGIVVALSVDGGQYAWPRWTRGKAGDERVIESARDIQMPWATYERAKAEFDAHQDAARVEKDRAMSVSDAASERLAVLGMAHTRSGSDFRFSADQMATLVALIREP